MKNFKKLSRENLRSINAGFVESSCSTECANGQVAKATCAGSCSTNDGIWAGCTDGSNETSMCPPQ